jgi:prepilin-type N-terminal cleavage/methylation domain-containing protein
MVRRSATRAFGLIELVVVLAVVLVLSTALIFRSGLSTSPADDAIAKASLLTFVQIQEEAFLRDVPPFTATDITSGDVDRGSTQFTALASTAASTVSVAVSGSVTAGAALTGAGDCWAVRLDADPTPTSPLSWWFLDEAATGCDATSFLTPTFPEDGTGDSPSSPSVL